MTDPAGTPGADEHGDDLHDERPADRSRKVVPLTRRRTREPLLRHLIGGVIRAARHDQQRTLADVAADAGVSVPYLSEIERGRKEPSSEMLAAVCRALDLDLVDLVSRTYVDLVERRYEVAEAEPMIVQTREHPRVSSRLGRSGDVLALAA